MTTNNSYKALFPMESRLLQKSIHECVVNSASPWIQVLLIDGTEIAGCYSSLEEEHISLEHNELFDEKSIFIPVKDIAGIAALSFHQDIVELDDATADFCEKCPSGYANLLNKRLIEVAVKRNYRIVGRNCLYCISPTKPFSWGAVSFENSTVIYRDPEFLTPGNNGGAVIDNVRFLLVTFKIQLNRAKHYEKQGLSTLKRRPQSLTKKRLGRTALLSGHLQFLEEVPVMTLDGEQWIPASISSQSVSSFAELFHCPWKLVYFCEKFFQHPKDGWEYIKNPIRVYGEVIEQTFCTEHGSQPHFLKALVAGCII